MRLKLIDRLLLVLLTLFVIALAAGCFAVALQLVPQAALDELVRRVYAYPVNAIILGVAGLLLLALAIKLLFAREGAKTPPQPQAALVKAGENGSVFISLEALNAMVQKHCRANARVRDCESHVCVVPAGVSIRLKLAAMPDTTLPELTQELQTTLKEYIQSLSGIAVAEIAIMIVSAPGNARARVD